MLSAAEISSVYGAKETPAQDEIPAPPAAPVPEAPAEMKSPTPAAEMPSIDDMDSGELNPQSLAFEEISVSSPAPQAPTPSVAASASTPRVGETSTPFLPDDSSSRKPHSAGGLGTAGAATIDAGDASASANVWQLAYYKPLFDVDSSHIVARLVHALLPRPRAQFFEVVAANPDLYGPFWISTTLIFVIAVTGNLANWLAFKPADDHTPWSYDFTKLTGASTAVYSYVSLAPLAVWAALRYLQATKRLVDIMCVYGYSLAIFVPISLLCVLPSSILRWIAIAAGGGVSGAFVLTNLYAHLQDCFPYSDSDSMKRGIMLVAGAGVGHAVFCLVLKICFFA